VTILTTVGSEMEQMTHCSYQPRQWSFILPEYFNTETIRDFVMAVGFTDIIEINVLYIYNL